MTIIHLQVFRCCQCHKFVYVPTRYLSGMYFAEFEEARARASLKRCPYCTSTRMQKLGEEDNAEIIVPDNQA